MGVIATGPTRGLCSTDASRISWNKSSVLLHGAPSAPSATGMPSFKSSDDGTLIAPSGSEVRSVVIYSGLNIFNKKGRCYFGGLAVM